MTRLNKSQEKSIKELASAGLSCKDIALKLNIDAQCIYRRRRKWKILSVRQSQIKEQLELKKQGKRKCHACKNIFPMTNEHFGYSKGIWRRRCKDCDNISATQNHHKRMLTLDLEGAIRYKIYQATYRSKQKHRQFNLTITDVKNQWIKQNGKCFYTGMELTTLPNHHNYLSIDRYDSSKGYSADNIVLCSHIINLMKKDLTEQEFRSYCQLVVDYKHP
jgi:hypothetical protein